MSLRQTANVTVTTFGGMIEQRMNQIVNVINNNSKARRSRLSHTEDNLKPTQVTQTHLSVDKKSTKSRLSNRSRKSSKSRRSKMGKRRAEKRGSDIAVTQAELEKLNKEASLHEQVGMSKTQSLAVDGLRHTVPDI